MVDVTAPVMNMALSVVSGAGSAAVRHIVMGVPREVESMGKDLEMMRAILLVALARLEAAARNPMVWTWVKQLRDLSYDFEDCLSDVALYSATDSEWSSWRPGALAARHGIVTRMRDLKASQEELDQRNQRYRFVLEPYHNMLSAAKVDLQQLPRPELANEEWDIIGRSRDKAALINKLLYGGGAQLGVVSVWGMGGMGKSSLISMVCNDPELLDAYDCSAWVTVPHPLDRPDALMRHLRKGLGLGADGGDEDNIKYFLRDKRYLIVVDDLLTKEEWDQVWSKLFNFQNAKGSRIIVTTRREDVARYCARNVWDGHGHVYELKPLDDYESFSLLCNKVHKTTMCIPDEMSEQASCILRRCQGLPLAICTIGGFLATTPKTSMEWMKLHEILGGELESGPRDIGKVIGSSCDGLPYQLKAIFLYLGIFWENHEIRQTRLVRQWMAEGYITKNRSMSMDEVGEIFYNQLINRSIIQPSMKKNLPGQRVKSCLIHNMVMQIIMSKVVEEDKLFHIEKQCDVVPECKIRHLVVSRWKRGEKLRNINLSRIRSLTIYGDCPISLISPKMRLLRVLDLEDTTNMKNEDLSDIGNLPHLRYISVRGTSISKLPTSLQNLLCLETLDIRDTQVTQLPHRIVKLEKLCYLLAGVRFSRDLLQKVAQPERDNTMKTQNCDYRKVSNMSQLSVSAPKGIDKLRNLHVFGTFNVSQGNGVAKSLKQLTNLQRVGITITSLTEKGCQELCQSLGKLHLLQKLEVRSCSLEFLAKMDESTAPKRLASLKLLGDISLLPTWITSLNDLTKVKLLGTNLGQGQVDILGSLRSVAFLGLWEKSYIGELLSFNTGKFPKLKFLDIDGLEKIEKVMIENDAMPELEQLWVNNCKALCDSGDGLSGVHSLDNLNELLVKKCGEKEKLIDTLQWQVSEHSKRPKFLTDKALVPTSSNPSTSAAAEQWGLEASHELCGIFV